MTWANIKPVSRIEKLKFTTCPACEGPLQRGFCLFCLSRAEIIARCRKCLARKIKWECDRCNNTGIDPEPKGYIGYRVRKERESN